MTPAQAQSPFAPWRSIGFWLAALIGLFQAFNAVRAVLDPAGFAAYLGAPLAAEADAAWVFVYALRTAFIALIVAIFLARGDFAALQWLALAGVVMPLGDALIAHQANAPAATLIRHAVIALYLVIAFVFLASAARRAKKERMQ